MLSCKNLPTVITVHFWVARSFGEGNITPRSGLLGELMSSLARLPSMGKVQETATTERLNHYHKTDIANTPRIRFVDSGKSMRTKLVTKIYLIHSTLLRERHQKLKKAAIIVRIKNEQKNKLPNSNIY